MMFDITACVMKIKYVKYKVEESIVLYENAAFPVICEDWHFTHTNKILT